MESFVAAAIAFVDAHREWAGPLLFLVCFGESFAGVSLLVPGTSILLAAGTLVPSGVLDPAPLLLWSIAGAVLGDAVSYWIGRRLGGSAKLMWPFSRHPALLDRGIRFFAEHGGKSVFIGRFFGPVRAVMPLAAGIMGMPSSRFWIANVASALLWAPAVLLPGAAIGDAVESFARGELLLPASLAGLAILGVAGLWIAGRRGRYNGS